MQSEITQADRDAAHVWVRQAPLTIKMALTDPKALYEAFARHREKERAEIVAWLRDGKGPYVEGYGDEIADAIERGDHRHD